MNFPWTFCTFLLKILFFILFFLRNQFHKQQQTWLNDHKKLSRPSFLRLRIFSLHFLKPVQKISQQHISWRPHKDVESRLLSEYLYYRHYFFCSKIFWNAKKQKPYLLKTLQIKKNNQTTHTFKVSFFLLIPDSHNTKHHTKSQFAAPPKNNASSPTIKIYFPGPDFIQKSFLFSKSSSKLLNQRHIHTHDTTHKLQFHIQFTFPPLFF